MGAEIGVQAQMRINPRLSDAVKQSSDVAAAKAQLAQEVVDAARDFAPPSHYGDYESGLHVEVEGDEVKAVAGPAGRGLTASGWIEFGTSITPAYAPLRKGAESVGASYQGPQK